jgi:hypothetical protein
VHVILQDAGAHLAYLFALLLLLLPATVPAGWILEIDRGTAYPHSGNYSSWLERKAARLDLEKRTGELLCSCMKSEPAAGTPPLLLLLFSLFGCSDSKKAKQMAEELAWIRQGSRGRQAKGKARVNAYEAAVKSHAEDREKTKFLSGTIVMPPAPRLGDVVVVAQGLSKAFEGRPVVKDLSFNIPPGKAGASHLLPRPPCLRPAVCDLVCLTRPTATLCSLSTATSFSRCDRRHRRRQRHREDYAPAHDQRRPRPRRWLDHCRDDREDRHGLAGGRGWGAI